MTRSFREFRALMRSSASATGSFTDTTRWMTRSYGKLSRKRRPCSRRKYGGCCRVPGASMRHCRYERMGFDASACTVLCGQGMNLSNLVNCARDNPEVEKAMLDCYL